MVDLPPPPVFLRMEQMVARLAISRSTIYRLIKEESFPRQIRISHRVAVWIESEVDAWMMSHSELRDLPVKRRSRR
ncbi:helix-turn-helix transcriptional regulator [Brevundimonas faecalis]|uniref:helix-turn-helix transcriptional regulator n=1 Tax=Brevundimonas faecalis TaxID=947378 RepID=UPI00339A9E8E